MEGVMLGLMTVPNSIGGVMGAWRHPDAWPDNRIMNLEHYISIAKTAERGKFDCLFVADNNAVEQMINPELFQALSPLDRPANFEPLTLYAALSQHTQKYRFCFNGNDDLRGAISSCPEVRVARPYQQRPRSLEHRYILQPRGFQEFRL